jgi:type I restriction enzyme, S subunit
MKELPPGWVNATISGIADVQLGKMLDRAKNRGSPSQYLRNINVRWGAFELSDLLEMPFTSDEVERFSIRDGDLMVCEGGEPGRAAVWRQGVTHLKYQKALHRVRPEAEVAPEYLAYFLRHASQQGLFSELLSGTTIKHLPLAAFSQLRVPLAPTEEQRRIVAKLDSLFARTRRAREELARIPRLIEHYRQSILTAAFSGDLTAAWRQERGMGSDAWRPLRLDNIITGIKAGKNLKCEERPPLNDERGVVKVSAVTWGIFSPTQSKTLPTSFNPDSDTLIRKGDFLFSRANTIELVGACVIVDEVPANLYLSDKVLRLDMPDVAKRWLLWFFRSPLGRVALEMASTGNQLSMRNISQVALLSIEIPWPSEAERSHIVHRIESTMRWLRRVSAEQVKAISLLDRLDQSTLAKAFRGELVAHDPNDEPAAVLLERIRAARAAAPRSKRGRRATAPDSAA